MNRRRVKLFCDSHDHGFYIKTISDIISGRLRNSSIEAALDSNAATSMFPLYQDEYSPTQARQITQALSKWLEYRKQA